MTKSWSEKCAFNPSKHYKCTPQAIIVSFVTLINMSIPCHNHLIGGYSSYLTKYSDILSHFEVFLGRAEEKSRSGCYKRYDWSDRVGLANQIARLIDRVQWHHWSRVTLRFLFLTKRGRFPGTGSDPCIFIFISGPPHHVFCGTARWREALLATQTAPLYDVIGSASSRPSILRLATMLSITCRHSFAPIRFRLVDCKVPPCKWRHRVTDHVIARGTPWWRHLSKLW